MEEKTDCCAGLPVTNSVNSHTHRPRCISIAALLRILTVLALALLRRELRSFPLCLSRLRVGVVDRTVLVRQLLPRVWQLRRCLLRWCLLCALFLLGALLRRALLLARKDHFVRVVAIQAHLQSHMRMCMCMCMCM